jgi:hypothetical protein
VGVELGVYRRGNASWSRRQPRDAVHATWRALSTKMGPAASSPSMMEIRLERRSGGLHGHVGRNNAVYVCHPLLAKRRMRSPARPSRKPQAKRPAAGSAWREAAAHQRCSAELHRRVERREGLRRLMDDLWTIVPSCATRRQYPRRQRLGEIRGSGLERFGGHAVSLRRLMLPRPSPRAEAAVGRRLHRPM